MASPRDRDIDRLTLHVKILYGLILTLFGGYAFTLTHVYRTNYPEYSSETLSKEAVTSHEDLWEEIRTEILSYNSGFDDDGDIEDFKARRTPPTSTPTSRRVRRRADHEDVDNSTKYNSSANGRHPNNWLVMPTHSRIPAKVLLEFCSASRQYCPKALHGRHGSPGMNGFPGPQGPPGYDGLDGRNGTNGIPGIYGMPGEPGGNGTNGEPGEKGDKGDTGESQNCTCPRGLNDVNTDSLVHYIDPDATTQEPDEYYVEEELSTPQLITTPSGPTIPLRIHTCRLRLIAKPVFQRYTNAYWGAWFKDPQATTKAEADSVYMTKHNTGSILYEYSGIEDFRKEKIRRVYDLGQGEQYIGTGHIVYNGSFYYHRSGFSEIGRFDLRTGTLAASLTLREAAYEGESSLYSTESNYFDLSADDNGLWLIYATDSDLDSLTVAKLNVTDLTINRTWNITVRRRSYGNGFVACGILYLIRDTTVKMTHIDFAYDLYEDRVLAGVSLRFINPFQMTSMIAFNHVDRQIYTWDKGNQLLYQINL